MRIDSYIEPRKLLGVSGLFSVNTSAGVIEGNSDYTRTELDGKTVFEYTLDGVRLAAEFTKKANGAIIRQDYFENTSDAPVHIYKIASRFHMDGNEYDVIVLVCKLHDFMHPSLVVLHAHESSEYAHTVIDVDDVVPYCK